MTCDDMEILIHALIDGELDAGHAREVEAHLAGCATCSAKLRAFREMRQAMSTAALGYAAPAALQARVERLAPPAEAAAAGAAAGSRQDAGPIAKPATSRAANPFAAPRADRRALLTGLFAGAAASAIAASGAFIIVARTGEDRRVAGDIVAAHLRSLQAQHLIDVQSSDQHTVKPWFNGRIDLAPPVFDLDAQGFTLVGGRLDYVDGHAAAAIVYRRRGHTINLFVMPGAAASGTPALRSTQGFNLYHWSDQGLDFWAVSDINAEELQEFGQQFRAAARAGGGA